MKASSYKYEYNPEGWRYQCQITSDYGGERLPLFRIVYAAKVYAFCRLPLNTVQFWTDMKNAGLFPYWDPNLGPHKWYNETTKPEVQMLRVYRVDCDLKPHVVPNVGYRNAPAWNGGYLSCNGLPVLNDQQIAEQFTKFSKICLNHGGQACLR